MALVYVICSKKVIYLTTRNQYASAPEGNAIPAGHVQKRLSLNLLSLRDL